MPVRDVGREAEVPHLGFEGDLALRIAVDEEHTARVAGITGVLSVREPGQPFEQLALVGVG